jgi:hypothetical protein
MRSGERRSWYQRWEYPIIPILAALARRYGFLPSLLSAVGVAALLLAAIVLVRDLTRKVRKVVVHGEPIPPYFGVSYIDRRENLCVCHVIPINLLVGD